MRNSGIKRIVFSAKLKFSEKLNVSQLKNKLGV